MSVTCLTLSMYSPRKTYSCLSFESKSRTKPPIFRSCARMPCKTLLSTNVPTANENVSDYVHFMNIYLYRMGGLGPRVVCFSPGLTALTGRILIAASSSRVLESL